MASAVEKGKDLYLDVSDNTDLRIMLEAAGLLQDGMTSLFIPYAELVDKMESADW